MDEDEHANASSARSARALDAPAEFAELCICAE
jgi:hypothetical protein